MRVVDDFPDFSYYLANVMGLVRAYALEKELILEEVSLKKVLEVDAFDVGNEVVMFYDGI